MFDIAKTIKTVIYQKRCGAALILSMIFVLVFSALAISMAAMSGSNLQIAHNYFQVNRALESAQSGLEVMRYHLCQVAIPGTAAPVGRLEAVANNLQSDLTDAGITNITANYDGASKTINIASVPLDTQSGRDFGATLSYGADYDTVRLDITGNSRQFQRQIRTDFKFATIGSNVFDFGIATKGPLNMNGSVDVEGLNENIEASVYIESLNSALALSMIGKSSIAGDVSIVNAAAYVDISNPSSVGGATGEEAMEHVFFDVPPSDFPAPNPSSFVGYIENIFIPGYTPTSDVTLQNIIILPDTNPSFSGNVTLNGVVYILPPNVVSFTGNTEITGIIVADGDLDSPSEQNRIEFLGTVNSNNISELPDNESFNDLKQESGTFMLAPGFSTYFGGSFDTLNGVIAASGISFHGNAGGTINGSVVNYSDTPMTLDGNTNLIFNRSGSDVNPAGFDPTKILRFLPTTYSEPAI